MTNDKKREGSVLAGHLFCASGRGEDVRTAYRSLRAVRHAAKVRDIFSFCARNDEVLRREFADIEVRRLSSVVNVFFINGNEVDQTLAHVASDLPGSAYNIVYPAWELSIYPKEWAQELKRFDEVWAPSRFTCESLQNAVKGRPIIHMPLATEVSVSRFLGRRYFRIPESAYVFLCLFDYTSFIARKNPYAAITAFEGLCARHPTLNVHLVIKTNQSAQDIDNASQFSERLKGSAARNRVTLLERTMGADEMWNLVRCADCFLSLHRAEGYGRGLAEAMFLGKPVVATGYSGNMDFMGENNSCLVKYQLIPVERGQYPMWKGQVWADPDINHAVWHMEKLAVDHDIGRRIGTEASRSIRQNFSYRACGLRYSYRLGECVAEEAKNEAISPIAMLRGQR